jgi:hypothetical protein
MFYIFNTEQEAIDYDTYVSEKKNYRGNRTTNWANARKHPILDKWAIVKNSQYPHETLVDDVLVETTVETTLDETWSSDVG